jgi:nitrite reductase/ring-hydroxylating ferredoxin subunit
MTHHQWRYDIISGVMTHHQWRYDIISGVMVHNRRVIKYNHWRFDKSSVALSHINSGVIPNHDLPLSARIFT